MSRKFAWAALPDEQLLKVRLKNLRVKVEGTWLEDCLLTLHDELAEHGLSVRPHAWISNEWFSPEDTPGIAMPFFLAHPRLTAAGKENDLGRRGRHLEFVHEHPAPRSRPCGAARL